MKTPVAKVWRVSQAIGDIAFAYPYSLILLEIQVRPPVDLHPVLCIQTQIETEFSLFRLCQRTGYPEVATGRE